MRFSLLLVTILTWGITYTTVAQASGLADLTPPTGNQTIKVEDDDPWDTVNHPLFDFNVFFDRNLAKPVQSAYHLLPYDIRHSIGNILTNLSEPLNTAHGVLQLNPNIAFTSLWRFILNTTFGFGGIRDFAGENGLHNMDQNFGKTMGRWGLDAGPYVVLPILGPSSVRDTTGKVADFFIDPLNWVITLPEGVAEGVTDGINTRDKEDGIINQLYYESLDPYVATRSVYRQHEAFEVQKKE